VVDIRSIGVMAGIEVAPVGGPGARGHAIQKALFDHGLHLKSTGDTLILAPAFVATDAHLDEIFTKIRDVLKAH
jgi:beta-alanine--pyruvate transaminase